MHSKTIFNNQGPLDSPYCVDQITVVVSLFSEKKSCFVKVTKVLKTSKKSTVSFLICKPFVTFANTMVLGIPYFTHFYKES
jgi:hypothetical protein